MQNPLPAPTPALAHRLLRPVSQSDRLVGYSLDFRQQTQTIDLLSLTDALVLLRLPHSRLSPGTLASWCEGVLGDQALAAAVRSIGEAPGTPPVQRRALTEIIEVRLLQAMRCASTVRLVSDPENQGDAHGAGEPGVETRARGG